MESDFILIPIELQAMIVSENQHEEYAGLVMNYTITGSHHRLGPSPESHPFSTISCEKVGIHLHWKLPDALTHGRVNADDPHAEIIWPALPDRWLVTRFWRETTQGELHSRHFIVESNALNAERGAKLYNEASPSWPWDADTEEEANKARYRFLGRSAPLEQKMDAPLHYLDKITATGAGSPGFAAFYPYCRNVFGFHDELCDANGSQLEAAYLCYSVVGWHARPQDSGEDEQIWLDFPPPAKRLLHGMIFGLNWQIDTNNEQNYHVSRTAVEVAVGNNSLEALSALQATKQPGETEKQERWNNLLLQNNTDTLQHTNGISDAEQNLHAMGFSVWHTPPRWGLKPTGVEKLPPEQIDALFRQLDKLNNLTTYLDRLEQESARLGQHIYECWCLLAYIAEQLSTSDADKAWQQQLDKIRQHILDSLKGGTQDHNALTLMEKEKKSLKDNINLYRAVLLNQIPSLDNQQQAFQLQQLPDEPFYNANNPVLLFKGLERSFAHGYNGRYSADGALQLRKTEDIISALLLPVSNTMLQASSLVQKLTYFPDKRVPLSIINALCAEAVLLCPDLTDLLVQKIPPTDDALRTTLITSIRHLQLMAQSSAFLQDKAPDLAKNAGFLGRFPSKLAINVHRPYWVPLFLEWDITFIPDKNVMKSAPDLSNWRLDNLEFSWQGSSEHLTETIRQTGRMLITPQAASVMQNMAEKLELPNADKYGLVDVLSQGLSDFHDQLLMRSGNVATPIISDNAACQALTTQVRSAVEQYVRSAPSLAGCYAPIRAGFMQVNSLRVIDSFGKFLLLSPEQIYRAESLRTADDNRAYGKRIMLPPRIMQPARLKAKWVGGKKQPIFGWLAYNHADKNLALYAPKGQLLGLLQQTRLKTPVVWAPMPGGCQTIDDLPEGLRSLGYFLCNAECQDLLTPLVELLNNALELTNPAGSASFLDTATFMSRPVALAGLDLWLDLASPPVSPPFSEVLPGIRQHIKLQQANFPVRLGEPAHHNDGVIGFFEHNDEGFTTFHSAYADDNATFSTDMHIHLSPGVAQPHTATRRFLLLDPLADIHLTSGILPRHTLGLPDEAVNRAMEEIAYSLFASPVLVAKTRTNLPVPGIRGATWSWLSPDGKSQPNGLTGGLAPLDGEPQVVMDGWLRLIKDREEETQ
ncbi:hypothetical protein [Klebsiella quasivariicola]|uniref:hypothetical protein n=1 Tax=Klebsiella quasivariicola TaxID=2026240 RepID=UPI002479EB79|nr:hypothetical protein [Klebsiella quasivariicola]